MLDQRPERGHWPFHQRSGLCEGQVRSSLAHRGRKQVVGPLCQELGTQEAGAEEVVDGIQRVTRLSAGLEGMESPLRVGLCALPWGAARSAEDVSLTGRATSWPPWAESHPNFCLITRGQTVGEAKVLLRMTWPLKTEL